VDEPDSCSGPARAGSSIFGFPGSQVPIPEGSQVPTRKTERIRCPRASGSGRRLYPRCHFPANCLGVSHLIMNPALQPRFTLLRICRRVELGGVELEEGSGDRRHRCVAGGRAAHASDRAPLRCNSTGTGQPDVTRGQVTVTRGVASGTAQGSPACDLVTTTRCCGSQADKLQDHVNAAVDGRRGEPVVVVESWYRIPNAREFRVNRANVTRFTLREPLWDAWCDSIRVLIRVLGDRDLNRLSDTAHCHRWRPRQVTGPY